MITVTVRKLVEWELLHNHYADLLGIDAYDDTWIKQCGRCSCNSDQIAEQVKHEEAISCGVNQLLKNTKKRRKKYASSAEYGIYSIQDVQALIAEILDTFECQIIREEWCSI